MILRTFFALIAAICFVTEIASAQVSPAPMMNPAAPAPPATAHPQANPPKNCQQKQNGTCKKKKKKKNKNKNANAGAPQAPPQAPQPATTP